MKKVPTFVTYRQRVRQNVYGHLKNMGISNLRQNVRQIMNPDQKVALSIFITRDVIPIVTPH